MADRASKRLSDGSQTPGPEISGDPPDKWKPRGDPSKGGYAMNAMYDAWRLELGGQEATEAEAEALADGANPRHDH